MYIDIEELERRLKRLTDKKNEMEGEHKGNEEKYTYWGGYNLGYLKGKIAELEETISMVQNAMDDESDNCEP